MRSINRSAPGFAVGSVARHRDRPERDGAAGSRWSGAAPYLLTTMSVAGALYGSFFLDEHGLQNLEFPLFLFAVASTIWYPGVGPAVLAVVLSFLAFDYYFVEPRYTVAVASAEVPYAVAFLLFAVMLTGFGVVRRRAEQELIRSRDQLRMEMAERQIREEQIRKLNEQLEHRTADLEVVNRELEAFAYSTSHDLRAPVRHMIGFTELLQRHAQATLDDKSRRYLTTILGAARRMGALIDDLLAFSRIGRVERQDTTVDLRLMVQDVIEQMRPDTRGRTIAWRIGDLPPLSCDPAMMRLVFVNLIANAIKFTRPRDAAQVEIGSFENERGLVVFVKDNGVGFDMQYSNKLFRVFHRLHKAEEFEGTGIGLATAQRIVHRHGGAMWAEGAVNRGATLFFSVSSARKRCPPAGGPS